MVIQIQRSAIADRHVPATATPLYLLLKIEVHAHRNQILLVGHHREACRLILPGLHRIESVRVRRRFFAINEPSERGSIWVDDPGRVGNGEQLEHRVT